MALEEIIDIDRDFPEQVRGKSRIVIDYRRLNDNTVDDVYDIPDKTELPKHGRALVELDVRSQRVRFTRDFLE